MHCKYILYFIFFQQLYKSIVILIITATKNDSLIEITISQESPNIVEYMMEYEREPTTITPS